MPSIVIRANPKLNFEEYTLTCVPEDSHGWAEAVFSEDRGDERANEGPHTFSFRLRAPENTLKELFARGLMRQVEVWDEQLSNEFQGYIHEMVYVLGNDRYTINLDNMLNKVFMRADYDGDGAVERSTTLENTASQNRFGTKEGVLSGGELEGLTVADQAVQAFIDRRGFPLPEPDLGGGGDGPYLEVFCRGYMNTLDWVLYNQTASTGTQGMSSQVSDIIGDRASVAIAQPATFDSTFDWEEGRPTDADALSPDWDHTVLDDLADADSEADADGDLNNSAAAAKLGSNGFEVTYDDANRAALFISATAVDRPKGTIDLWLDTHTLTFEDDSTVIDWVAFLDGGGNRIWIIQIRRSSGNFQLRLNAARDTGGFDVVQFNDLGTGYNHIRLAFQRSSGAGNDDGFAYMRIDRGDAIESRSITGIDNDTLDWDEVAVGMYNSFGESTFGGAFRFDEIRVSESVSPVWITEAAARDGSYGAAYTIEDTTARYSEDQEPTNATEIARELWVRPPGTMATDDEFHVMTLREDGGAVDAARVILGYDGSDYYVKISARLDGGSYTTSDKTIIHPLYTNHLRVHWLASSGVGNDDGRMYLFQRDNQRLALTELDNDTLNVDTIREGAVAGLDAGTSGVLFLDTQRHSTEALITVTGESGVGEFIASKDLDANATTVTKEYDADRRALPTLQSLWSLGDSNNNRWVGRIRGKSATTVVGREFVLKQAAPTEVPAV